MVEYNEKSIQVLKGLQAVRKRPGMYIGSTDEKGLHHLVWEIVDNSIDEVLNGYCDTIDVIIYKNGFISVSDNGRGIPFAMHKNGKSTPEVIFTELHSGGKFDNSNYKVSGGLHGVGASVVNALSSDLFIQIKRQKQVHHISFSKGGKLKMPITKVGTTNQTGTFIKFCPDKKIFSNTDFNYNKIASKLKEKSYLISSLKINLEDKRSGQKNHFNFKNGLSDFLKEINLSTKPIHKAVSFFLKKDISIDFAFQYNESNYERIYSFVNNIKTVDGGTHEQGLKSAFTKAINEFSKKHNLFKHKFLGEDVREGLSAIISLKIPEKILEFEGQTKSKLGTSVVKGIVENFIFEKLTTYLEENREQGLKIINNIIEIYRGREAAKKAKQNLKTTREKLGKENSFVGKLTPAQSKDKNKIELYLVEGDSAGGSAKQARNRKLQAILPLKGKVLNVEKSPFLKSLQNEEIMTIISVIGAGVSKTFDIKKCLYDKIIIMTDADTDGAHIQALLLTFFYRYMKELLIAKKIYIALPPLYKITSRNKSFYAWNDKELSAIKQDLPSYTLQRYKGLGEMNPDQLWDTTMNPKDRKIIQVEINDEIAADVQVSTLMGTNVESRKKWILNNIKFTLEDDFKIKEMNNG